MKAIAYEKYGPPEVLRAREQIVEAYRYVDKGHKKGNVVMTLDHNNKETNIS